MAALGSLSGCVVTDPIEFERPENNPPAFVIDPLLDVQPGQTIYLLKRSGAPGWDFDFKIRDVDVDQDLEVQWRIFTGDDGPRKPTRPLAANGSEVRELTITINNGDLRADECHHVEVAVSANFFKPIGGEDPSGALFGARAPEHLYDYDIFTFDIWEGDPTANDPMKIVETCGAKPFTPTVPTGTEGMAGAAGENVQ